MRRIEAIIWDSDGVLIDTESLFYKSTLEALMKFGYNIDDKHFRKLFFEEGKSLVEYCVTTAKRNQYKAEEVYQLRSEYFEKMLVEMRDNLLFPGTLEILKFYHGKVKMGVVTGSQRIFFEHWYSELGLIDFFDFSICREDYEHVKPHPEPYLKAISQNGICADKAVAIEDTIRGFRSAIGAGLKCYVVNNQYLGSQITDHHERISDLLELKKTLSI